MRRKSAFYTLEATWMFGLTVIIFFGILLLEIRLYHETVTDIESKKPAEIHAVSKFRKIGMYRDIKEEITGDKKEE